MTNQGDDNHSIIDHIKAFPSELILELHTILYRS